MIRPCKISWLDEGVFQWVVNSHPESWSCRQFDEFFKTDYVTNNMIEIWNECLNEYKRQLVIQLLEFIILKIMKRLIRRRKKVEKWELNLPPRVQKKKIKEYAKAARKLLVVKFFYINLFITKYQKDNITFIEFDLQNFQFYFRQLIR